MSGGRKINPKQDSSTEITILLVDDIPEARENIKKLLAFEQDFKVVGTAATGREGVELAKHHQPDIIVMDINMPDMDGLTATNLINKQVPTAAVIIMSVQTDADYMRRAMLAGARDFLGKPVNMDDLYNTIRTVYRNHEPIRRQYAAIEQGVIENLRRNTEQEGDGERAGHVIVVYGPQGGVGKTTIATSVASGLMKEDVKVLLVDSDLQFADVATFLNLQPQSTIVEVAEDVDDLDVELFENIVMTHDSGLKVLVGPARPELGETVMARPDTVASIVRQVRSHYDFIVVDTASRLDETVLNLFEEATVILLTGTPTLISVKNMKFVLDLFDQLNIEADKTQIVLNKIWDDRRGGKSSTVPVEPVVGQVPVVDERILLSAINKGVPAIASDRNVDRPPIKQLIELSNRLFDLLMGDEEEEEEQDGSSKKRGGIASFLGR
ncbi:MAG: response regulator [Chloroflexota bacterium]